MLLVVTVLTACSQNANGIPDWLALRPGVQARLDYSVDYDPENANVFATVEAARANAGVRRDNPPGAEHVPAGTVVTIKTVEQKPEHGKHIVSIVGATFSGWVVAEEALLPIPPADAELILPASISHVGQMLYGEQDEDDGVSVGVTSHVRFKEFDSNPGNPEYLVTVEDGTLAGRSGYLFAAEIEPLPDCSFTLRMPNQRCSSPTTSSPTNS